MAGGMCGHARGRDDTTEQYNDALAYLEQLSRESMPSPSKSPSVNTDNKVLWDQNLDYLGSIEETDDEAAEALAQQSLERSRRRRLARL